MRIINTRVDSNIHNTRNTLTQRMFGPTSTGVVALDVSGIKNGDTAGLAAFADQYGFVGVTQAGGQRYLIMVNNNGKNNQEIERVPLSQNRVYLRVHGDFTFINGNFNNRIDDATFAYSLDGSSWQDIGNTLQMTYELTHFMGYRFALFNYATQSTGGYADFDYFRAGE
jgi:beta-xylosidase